MNCRKCKVKLNKDNWPPHLKKRDGYICTDCHRERCRDYYKKRYKGDSKFRAAEKTRTIKFNKEHPEKRRKIDRRTKLRSKYGIVELDFDKFYNNQKGCCAICGIHQSRLTRSLDVDHNHETDKIRGLLCSKCNLALGGFQVDESGVSLLKKAIQYLRKT